MALSSGFMTYHGRGSSELRRGSCRHCRESDNGGVAPIAQDKETCVTEIVRRQIHRHVGLVAAREEVKIRRSLPVYMALPAPKVTTMQAPEAIASDIIDLLWHNSRQHSNR